MIRLGLAALITVLVVLGGIQYVGRGNDNSIYGRGNMALDSRLTDVVEMERAFLGAIAYARPAPATRRPVVARAVADERPQPHIHGLDTSSLISAYPWPQDEAWDVMMCESSGDPTVSNSGESIGLFEIHYPSHWDKVESLEALFDPTTNVHVAFHLWEDQGWEPWSDSMECHGL